MLRENEPLRKQSDMLVERKDFREGRIRTILGDLHWINVALCPPNMDVDDKTIQRNSKGSTKFPQRSEIDIFKAKFAIQVQF